MKPKNIVALLVIIIFFSVNSKEVKSASVEFMSGLSYQTFDDYPDYNDFGASLKLRYFRFNEGAGLKHGLFGAIDFPAIYFTIFDAMIGYGLRTGGDVFFDFGAAYAYSPIWGSRPTVVFGFGFNFSNQWYLNFPIVISAYGGISSTPMFGYYF